MSDELPVGLYEQLITENLESRIAKLSNDCLIRIDPLDVGDSFELLSRHLFDVIRHALRHTEGENKEKLAEQLAVCNRLLTILSEGSLGREGVGNYIAPPPRALSEVAPNILGHRSPQHPIVPLSASALIVNDSDKISIGAAINQELQSADRVDLICAFVNHTGVRILEHELKSLCQRGVLRVITTTYMGATQRKALDLLIKWGAQVRIVYELPPANTKLHAKAWLFFRNTGFHTAYIGSSNISHSALMDGLEWNVRLSNIDAAQIIAKFQSTFERYWQDAAFEPYEPGRDAERLDKALAASDKRTVEILDFFLDVKPWPHQSEILEQLQVERERHNKWRSLIVAATGTGKTIVAALDFKRLRTQFGDPKLLFVAHREEILVQSVKAFRSVLRQGDFGELWVGGKRPADYRHVFASIQSLANSDFRRLPADHFDILVIDEFHHAAAVTYKQLLAHLKPKVLLVLTATPERTDNQDILAFVGGESTINLRLWDAISRGLLCPFQYFGVSDNEDLRDLRWEGGKYRTEDLDRRFVDEGDNRARLVFEQVARFVYDWTKMRAIGFCSSVKHAEFMARKFQEFGVACQAVSAKTDAEERNRAVKSLRNGTLNLLFSVDLFNEGIDIPELDTVLFLRPTESSTVYIQQLGRGLRLCEGKPCLTVLDFIGQQNQKFRFDLRYRALTGLSRTALESQFKSGFTEMPAGCNIQLDRVAQQTILDNLRRALPSTTPKLISELLSLAKGDASYPLMAFLRETGLEAEDLYRNNRSYTSLKRGAGLRLPPAGDNERQMNRGIERLLGVNAPERMSLYRELLQSSAPPELDRLSARQSRMIYMLASNIFQNFTQDQLREGLSRLWKERAIVSEMSELLQLLDDRATNLPTSLTVRGLADVPIKVHSTYRKDEVMAAFGMPKPSAMREGVKYFDKYKCDVFFVTLRKTDHEYSATTRYDDYPISPTLFHWESQSVTSPNHESGKRYIYNTGRDSSALLFVRESKLQDGRTAPYQCLGPVTYVRHESERPMRITWELETHMPTVDFLRYKSVAG